MTASIEKPSLWRRLIDTVFGYDYFISYAWSDGQVYATKLAESLRNSGFECFLDSSEYRTGDDWRKVGTWTLKRTSSLILVGSPNAVRSEPVLYEVRTFRRFNNRIVPIDFDGTLNPRKNGNELLRLLSEDIIRLKEPSAGLATGPSDTTIRRLHDDFKGIRQAQWRSRLLASATLAFALIAAVTVWMFFRAETARREERRQNMINVAQKLDAEAINETARLEHERAALLARQAYLLNKRYQGDVIARTDYALRSVLSSPNFNIRLTPDFKAPGGSGQVRIRSIAYAPKSGIICMAVDITAAPKDEMAAVADNHAVGIVRLQDAELTWTPLKHPPLALPSLAISPDGKKLAVAGADRAALLYDTTAPEGEPKLLPVDDGNTTSLAFGHDSKSLVAGTDRGTIHGWDFTDRGPAHRLIARVPSDKFGAGTFYAMALSPDSKALATAEAGGAITLWDLKSNQPRVLTSKARSRSSRSIAFSPDGRWLAAASTSPAQVFIWATDQLDAPPLIHKLSSPLSVAFTSDGRTLLAGNGLGQLYKWATNQLDAPPAFVSAHMDEIRALTVAPNDHHFITGSRDGTLRIWEPYSDIEASFRWTPEAVVEPVVPGVRQDGFVAYDGVSRSGVSRSADGMLYIHRNLGQDERVEPLGVYAGSAAFSATGRFLAVALPTAPDPETGDVSSDSVVIWDLRGSPITAKMEWGNSTKHVSSGDVQADALDSGLVELRQANEPAGAPVLLEVPDSRSAPSLSFNAEGTYLLAMSKLSERFNVNRTLSLHVASTAMLAGEVCLRVRRNLTREEWRGFVGPSIEYERTCPNLPAGP